MDHAKERLGDCLITEGLFRVDVFEVYKGKYVVNEFESLDADVYGTATDRGNNEQSIREAMRKYWTSVIETHVSPFVCAGQ